MKLIIIRHGESEANRLGIHAGQKDFDLSEEGKKQAELVAKRLENKEIEAIYSSDLSRASSTAKAIAKNHKLEVINDKRLREFDSGIFGEMPLETRWEWWGDYKEKEAKKLKIKPLEVKIPKGESEQDFLDRVGGFINEIRNKHKGTVVIVAHGGTNKIIFHLIGYKTFEDTFKIPQKNTCINEFKFDGRKWKMIKLNCLKHLEELG